MMIQVPFRWIERHRADAGAANVPQMGKRQPALGRVRGALTLGVAVIAACVSALIGFGTAAPIGPGTAAAAPEGKIATYRESWVHRALVDQYRLGHQVPLRNAQWIGAHNAYNSPAEMGFPVLSPLDRNQSMTIRSLLDSDVRWVEVDVHKWHSARPGDPGFGVPVVCHATGPHLGCSFEKPLRTVLGEIADWLAEPHNRGSILMLYLEAHLDDAEGYDRAATVIEEALGDEVYRPRVAPGGCKALPLGLSRRDIRRAGKRLIIVADGCDEGNEFRKWIFDWDDHVQERPRGFEDFPSCGPDVERRTYEENLIRYYEDSTDLTNQGSQIGIATADDGITPPTAAALARCGVDVIGLDRLTPFDGRLESLVWSWAPAQPAGGRRRGCAQLKVSSRLRWGRWQAQRCGARRPVACRTSSGVWKVLASELPYRRAGRACRSRDSRFGVPRTGFESQLLRQAIEAAGVDRAWLRFRRTPTGWRSRAGR